jgi:long-chain acyl-CoA synthetase
LSQLLLGRLLTVAARLPGKACIVDGAKRVTYGELVAQVGAVAASLRGRISAGDRVAILMDNSAEYVSSYYGAWSADGVALGLNTALKAEDLASMVAHSGAACLMADPGHPELPKLQRLISRSVHVLAVRPGAWESRELGPPARGRQAADALACLTYTSGTTGDAKGVMLSHRAVAANTDSICECLGIHEDDVALCVLPFFYSYGASVLHTHLTLGATLVLEKSLMYPGRVLDRMVAERATSFAGVPSTYYLLLHRADLARYDLSALRYVTQAGGRMEPDKIREFRDRVPSAGFVVMYGQTEATARITCLPPSELDRKPGSAGRAIPGVELRVRSEDDMDLPPMATGEVCVRGDNVMMGYWSDPSETANVLKDGWLHTGDLGYLDDEGYLFLVGRSREMIKTGAHRIGPGEIEAVIRTVPGVDDVVVVGVPDDLLGQAVKACVIAGHPSALLERAIQRACRERLPLFKVPKVIEFRTAFPRTSSGKIRRHLL